MDLGRVVSSLLDEVGMVFLGDIGKNPCKSTRQRPGKFVKVAQWKRNKTHVDFFLSDLWIKSTFPGIFTIILMVFASLTGNLVSQKREESETPM